MYPTKQKCSFTLLWNHKSSLPPPDSSACSNAERCLSDPSGRGLHRRLWRKWRKLLGWVCNMDFFFPRDESTRLTPVRADKGGGEIQERQIYYWSGRMRKQPHWRKEITSEFTVTVRGSEFESLVIRASLTKIRTIYHSFLDCSYQTN